MSLILQEVFLGFGGISLRMMKYGCISNLKKRSYVLKSNMKEMVTAPIFDGNIIIDSWKSQKITEYG